MEEKKVIVEEKKVTPPAAAPVDAGTLTFIVYIMYKLNMITRIQVRDFLNMIKEGKYPANVTEYLMAEVKKI